MYNNRQRSIEFLRVLMMFAIVLGHCLLYAYNGSNNASLDVNGVLARILTCFCYPAVNVLVLISGYFTIGSKSGRFLKLRKLSKLYVQILFYTILFLLLFVVFLPNQLEFHPSHWLPLKSDVYWFMTEYFKLMLICPFLVRLVEILDKKWYKLVLSVLFILTVVINVKGTLSGYSLISFVFLFLTSGYLKIYRPHRNVKIAHLCLIYLCALLLCFSQYSLGIQFFNWLVPQGYSNIFVVIMSLCILLLFAEKIPMGGVTEKVSSIAPLTLGVYLIHEHPMVRTWLWGNVSSLFPTLNILNVLATSFVVFIACIIIEKIRQLVFKLCKVDWLIDGIFDRLKILIK